MLHLVMLSNKILRSQIFQFLTLLYRSTSEQNMQNKYVAEYRAIAGFVKYVH